MRRPIALLIALGSLGVVLLLAARHVFAPAGQPPLPMVQVRLGESTIVAEIATTPKQQQAGLSGRSGLENGRGMLFVLEPPKIAGLWMKDMRFPLDIVYVDADGVVMTIHRDVPPDSYPRMYYPVAPAKYALEVPAGFTTAHHVGVGDIMSVTNRR